MIYTNIKVIALTDTDLKDFLILLTVIQFLGEAGANREIKLRVDGDGSGRYKFEIDGEPLRVPPLNSNDLPGIYLGE
jgi:hypothetical protein